MNNMEFYIKKSNTEDIGWQDHLILVLLSGWFYYPEYFM